jgi:hypothetical protein
MALGTVPGTVPRVVRNTIRRGAWIAILSATSMATCTVISVPISEPILGSIAAVTQTAVRRLMPIATATAMSAVVCRAVWTAVCGVTCAAILTAFRAAALGFLLPLSLDSFNWHKVFLSWASADRGCGRLQSDPRKVSTADTNSRACSIIFLAAASSTSSS